MATEELRFKIGLSGSYHRKAPEYVVHLNDTEYAKGTVTSPAEETFYVEFNAEVEEDATYVIKISLKNKQPHDTVLDENGNIVEDLLLNIKSIEIDEVDLGPMIWTNSKFVLTRPQKFNGAIITELDSCVNLGFNGTYEFTFTSPFYMWLLEAL